MQRGMSELKRTSKSPSVPASPMLVRQQRPPWKSDIYLVIPPLISTFLFVESPAFFGGRGAEYIATCVPSTWSAEHLLSFAGSCSHTVPAGIPAVCQSRTAQCGKPQLFRWLLLCPESESVCRQRSRLISIVPCSRRSRLARPKTLLNAEPAGSTASTRRDPPPYRKRVEVAMQARW